MSRAKNEPIGEVECPQKGCSSTSKVYRFQARGTGSARFAGKLYADCPDHGRYGADGKQAAQEYILENATIWGDQSPAPAAAGPAPVAPVKNSAAPAPAPVAPVKVPVAPVKRPAPATPVKAPVAAVPSPPWWESWQPIIK